MSYAPTGAFKITKGLQYVEESTFGTTPTASPAFTSAGAEAEIRESSEATANKYRQLGSEDIYKMLKTGEIYSFEVRYQPITSALIKYGTQAAAYSGATGTIDKSLSFLYAQTLDATLTYWLFKGSVTDRVDVEITESAVQVTQNFLCRQIAYTQSANAGLTTPTFASADTTAPWVGSDSSSNPFTFNSNNYDTPRFRTSVNRNLKVIKPNGETLAKFILPTNRDVTVEFDTWRKGTVLVDDALAMTARTASYVMKSATSTISYTNLSLAKIAAQHQAAANDYELETYSGTAQTISVS